MRKASNGAGPGWFAAALAVFAVGCAPELGDSCRQNIDCSVQGDRDCDISAPGGYCTISDCVAGSCQGEGHCVRFEPDQLRLASSWCMAKCGRGCRDGYRCVNMEELNAERCGVRPNELDRLYEARDADTLNDDDAADLAALRRCLNNTPRLAEVLDNNADARFCVQQVNQTQPPPQP